MINKHVNKSSGIEIIHFCTSHFSCSYHAAWHAHEHILNINPAACLSFFLSCNIKRWYLINFPINYENRIYFLPISILSCRFFTCYGGFFYYHAQFRFIMRFILFELTSADLVSSCKILLTLDVHILVVCRQMCSING